MGWWRIEEGIRKGGIKEKWSSGVMECWSIG
jgi:hypothetical protein